MDFSNKVFIVTGASSGIGRGCVEQIIGFGGTAIGVDINESTFEHKQYQHYVLSVTNEPAVEKMVNEVAETYSRIDGLVNAAGIWGSGKEFFDMDTDAFRRVFEVNTMGTFLTSKYVSKISTAKVEATKATAASASVKCCMAILIVLSTLVSVTKYSICF